MLGKIIIDIAFVLSLVSSILYLVSYSKKGEVTVLARRLFYGVIAGIILVSGILLVNIFNHNYQFTYIWENSNSQLPPFLLMASFYAGQQGSFLLWLLFFAIIGIFLIPYSKKSNYEPMVMGFYGLIIMFLLLLLIVKSPFDFVWETFKDRGVETGFLPEEGRGLNPILENYWMVIHPPILFIGYATLAIPFVFAITALIRKEYKQWVELAYPWVLSASAILGLGIMLGGFWAYETLGWGGFWGWDPVENSSLLPWLTSMALVHTMIIQRKTDGLVKTNFILAIVSFILVLYATFLTRSGILGASSVHSFTDPGSTVYFILIGILILFVLFSLYTFFMRAKEISSNKINMSYASREFMLALGSIFILLSSVLVFFGTSWPIITELFGFKKSSVATSFYNDTNLPIAFLILLSNAICLFMSWKKTQFGGIFKKALLSLFISLIFSGLFIFYGITQLTSILLLFAIIFSFIVNAEFAINNLRKNPFSLGGYLSHIGISFFMIGILILGVKSSSVSFQIKKGDVKNISGYNISFVDKLQIDKELKDRQKFLYRLNLEKNGNKYSIDPVVYWSDFNERKSPIIEPGIKSFFLEDVYLVLKSSDYDKEFKSISIRETETIKCFLDTNISISLDKFEMGQSKEADKNHPLLGALVTYKYKGKESVDTLFTKMKSTSEFSGIVWKNIPNTDYDIAFWSFVPSQTENSQFEAAFTFKKSSDKFIEPLEILTMEVSFKPFISFVWIGVMVIVLGFIISFVKNLKEKSEIVEN